MLDSLLLWLFWVVDVAALIWKEFLELATGAGPRIAVGISMKHESKRTEPKLNGNQEADGNELRSSGESAAQRTGECKQGRLAKEVEGTRTLR